MTIPVLSAARPMLRGPILSDPEHRAAHCAPPRPVREDGPHPCARARRIFASEAGRWPLTGYGPFSMETGGACVGEVGICHAADDPGREPGWFVTPQAEGRGSAAGAQGERGRPGIDPGDVMVKRDLRGRA